MATASLVDKATNSEFLSQPDWSVNSEIIDILNGVPELIPETISLMFTKMTSGDAGAQLLTLHLLDAILKSCKAVSGIFKKSLKRWEEWVSENKRTPLVREKALELTDLWARSLGGPFSDVASALARKGLQYRGKQQPIGVGPVAESPQPGRLPPLQPVSVLPSPPAAGPGRSAGGNSEVASMRESVQVLHEMLLNSDLGTGIVKDEVVGQLLAGMHQNIQPRIAVLIEHGNLSEDLFALNDLCLKIDEMYKRMSQGLPVARPKPAPAPAPAPASPPVAKADPVLIPFVHEPKVPAVPAPSLMPKAPPQQVYGIALASSAAADVPLLRPPPSGSSSITAPPSPLFITPTVQSSHAPAAAPSPAVMLPVVRAAPPAIDDDDEFAALARRPTKTTSPSSGTIASSPLVPLAMPPSQPPVLLFPNSSPSHGVVTPFAAMPAVMPMGGMYAMPPAMASAPAGPALLFPSDAPPTPILTSATVAASVSASAPASSSAAPSSFAGLYNLKEASKP